ncbi:MAG: hypothetical protein EBY62_08830, partial [Cellvibrionales bacterium]|nr:hypothetical protein [Cellvibrionales bacterium]
MKYVTFQKVSIRNFLSVGENPVVVEFNSGLNIITGNNKDKVDRRNGVGKSTVADSVYFAIFGTTLRELKKDHVVNNITQRDCEVQLDFTVNQDSETNVYRIVRKIAPTKCYLYRDGEDITRDSIVNTTDYICDLLNTTPDVFQNCVIMTVNNVTPFMAKKKLEKRKFIEGLKLNKQKLDQAGTEQETCPVCFSKLDDDHRHQIDDRKKELKQSIVLLKDKVNLLNEKLEEAKQLKQQITTKREKSLSKINDYQLKLQELESVKQQINQITTLNKDIDDDIESLQNKDTNIDRLISETEKRLESTQKVIDVVKKEMAKLEIIKFIVSEEGVKSYIVKKILQLFNSKLAHYLKKMDSNCICVFNEYFEEEIVNEKGKPCSYFNFSGAERKNIDLACLFAFMDIRRMQGDVAFNFSIYDELFDSSLDERGVELVIDI